jgi:hypothetical protein
MRRNGLFYCSFGWCRRPAVARSRSQAAGCGEPGLARAGLDRYLGMSRCTTFTRYPAFCSRLVTSSEIMTERCLPPVQPKAMVR